MSEQRERVYDFPNGFQTQAESIYGWLRHEGFAPEWDCGVRDGEYCYGITIPAHEVSQLRIFQKTNPARWGNHPDVAAELKASQQQAERDAEVNRQRLDRLNPEQREWIEQIHYETGLYVGQALDLNDKLHDLAAKHLKLCLIDVEHGLSSEQEAVRDAIESQVQEICGGIKGIKEAKFLYDPRGTTVAVVFESGAHNSFSGGWKVPVDAEYLKSIDADAFTSEHVLAQRVVSNLYGYYINTDERGDFYADVRNADGQTVFEIRAGDSLGEDESSIFEDGFMRNKDDLPGLTDYLRSLGVIPQDAEVLSSSDFEQRLESTGDENEPASSFRP